MKKILCLAIVLLLNCCLIIAVRAENRTSELSELMESFDIYQEGTSIYIEGRLTAEEKDFSHKNNSNYYYNSIFPDLIILDSGTENEIVIPRIWIYYRTEGNALNIQNIEFSIYNSIYNFSIDSTDISAFEKGTISEEAVVLLGSQSTAFLNDWYYIASINKPITVKLIGKTDTVEFDIPAKVVNTGRELFWAYAIGGGEASIQDYEGTPVTITEKNDPVPQNMYQVYRDESNGTTFHIPSGWAVVWNDSNDTSTSVKIRWESKDRETYANIQYKTSDIYQQMIQASVISKNDDGFSRSMLDNSLMTKADFADIFNVSVQTIGYEKHGDYMYYTGTVTKTETITPGYDHSVTVKFYGNIDNGIMYIFSFTGEESKMCDFEELLASVKHAY